MENEKTCNCLTLHIIPLKAAIANRDAEIVRLKKEISIREEHLEHSRKEWSKLYANDR